ncbi:MAG: DUF4235 domain-containing protein [Actinomycetota bacterium]|nr:DUF4235 domain-containing protein [Actinomycetota bacterium]
MAKLIYRPLGMMVSVVGGLLASAVFKRLWKAIGHEQEAPSATERRRSWGEILTAAATQGAIFGLVKAAVDRGGAVGFRKATGTWPGDE